MMNMRVFLLWQEGCAYTYIMPSLSRICFWTQECLLLKYCNQPISCNWLEMWDVFCSWWTYAGLWERKGSSKVSFSFQTTTGLIYQVRFPCTRNSESMSFIYHSMNASIMKSIFLDITALVSCHHESEIRRDSYPYFWNTKPPSGA
jgi:hypothetical protein